MYEEFFAFAVMVIAVSVTGVMAPGPLLAANISYGMKGGMKSGVKMAIGHTVVEIPMVVLLGFGIFSLEQMPWFLAGTAVAGAIGMFVFAAMHVRSALRQTSPMRTFYRNPWIAGIMFSFLNPFFIIWWGTIGLKMITDSVYLWGIIGIPLLFGLHIWIDYAWMMTVGHLSKKMSRFISNNVYRIIMFGMSLLLAYFGIVFAIDAMKYYV